MATLAMSFGPAVGTGVGGSVGSGEFVGVGDEVSVGVGVESKTPKFQALAVEVRTVISPSPSLNVLRADTRVGDGLWRAGTVVGKYSILEDFDGRDPTRRQER